MSDQRTRFEYPLIRLKPEFRKGYVTDEVLQSKLNQAGREGWELVQKTGFREVRSCWY